MSFSLPKKIAIASLALCPLFAFAQVVEESPHPQPIVIKKAKLNTWSDECLQAVRAEQTSDKRIEILSASIKSPKTTNPDVVHCTVNTKVKTDVDGKSSEVFMRYNVRLDTQDRKASVIPIDLDGATKAAQVAMAEKFMTVSPTSGSKDNYRFTATLDGHSCVVDVDRSDTRSEGTWVVSDLNCDTEDEDK